MKRLFETEWADDKELFALCKRYLYTGALCDVLDTLGYSHQYLPNRIQSLRQTDVMCGRAYPTIIDDVYGEQEVPLGLLPEAIDNISEDEIYVVAGGARRCSYFGEIMAARIKSNKGVGAVIDGYIRDTQQVLEQDFPVFSMGRDAQGSAYRNQVVAYKVPVEIGNILINPGDLIFGDIDGVVVIPKSIEDEAITVTLAKIREETETRAAIDEGLSAVEAIERYGVF